MPDGLPTYQTIDTPFQPTDYSFLQTALQKKETQFETGAAKIKGLYNSILNSQLTNDQNVIARDKYINSANRSMQSLSKADLSLAQNVTEAQKVFTPFWEDSDIVSDIFNTKKVQANASQYESWKTSTDENIRKQYNSIQEEYNNQTLAELKRAKRGDGSIQKVSARSVLPYKDKMEYLRNAADKSGYKIEYDYVTDDKGNTSPYIKKVTNGAETVPNWEVWADSVLGDNFAVQDRMFGQVSVDRLKNHFLSTNPDLSDADLNRRIGENALPTYEHLYNEKFDKYKSSIDTYNAWAQEIKDQAVDAKGNPRKFTEAERKALDHFYAESAKVSSLQKKLTQENPEIFNNQRNKIVERIAANPLQYYADEEHRRAITNFAKGITALGSTTLTANPVWQHNMQMKYNYDKMRQDYNLAIKGFELDAAKIRETHFGNVIEGISKGVTDANGNIIAPGSNPYISKGTTDISNLPNALEVYNQDQSNIFQKGVIGKVFDYTGVAGVLTNRTIGMQPQEVTEFCSVMKKWASPEGGTLSEKDKVILNSVRKRLENANVNVPFSIEGFTRGLFQYTKNEASRKDLTGVERKTMDERVLSAGIEAENALDEWKANDVVVKSLLQKELITNPNLQKVTTYKDENGVPIDRNVLYNQLRSGKVIPNAKDGTITIGGTKYSPSIITASEIAQKITRGFVGVSGDEHQFYTNSLSIKELADAYRKGTLKYTISADKQQGTENVTSVSLGNGKEVVLRRQEHEEFQKMMRDVENSIGAAKNFKDIEKTINEKVVAKIPKYANQTGKFGSVLTYSMANPGHKNFVRDASIELSAPSNQIAVYENNDKHSEVDDMDVKSALQDILSSGKENLVNSVSYVSKGFDGSEMWEVKLGNAQGLEKTTFGNENLTIDKLPGKSYLIKVDPATNSKLLKNFPKNSGNYINYELLEGKTKEGSEFLKSRGFPFTITPNRDGGGNAPDYYIVNVNPSFRDPATGNLIPQAPLEQIYDANTTDPDQLYNSFIDFGIKYTNTNNTNLKKFNQATK